MKITYEASSANPALVCASNHIKQGSDIKSPSSQGSALTARILWASQFWKKTLTLKQINNLNKQLTKKTAIIKFQFQLSSIFE